MRFHKGDIVEVCTGRDVHLAVVASDGPTVELRYGTYKKNEKETGWWHSHVACAERLGASSASTTHSSVSSSSLPSLSLSLRRVTVLVFIPHVVAKLFHRVVTALGHLHVVFLNLFNARYD